MGFLLVVMVFVFPLALPVVTFATLLFVARAAKQGLAPFLYRALKSLPLLVVLAGPGVVSGGAGSFLLPWWMHVIVGHSGVRYYVFQYAGFCAAFLFLLLGFMAIFGVSRQSSSMKRYAPGHRRRMPPR